MNCPGCGNNTNFDLDTSGTYCANCSSEQGITKLISDYFHRGYPYGEIVGLLSAAGVQISVRTLKRRLRSLGLKRKGQIVDEQHLRDVIRDEIEGAEQLSGYRSVWHALRLRHGIHVSRHVVARIIKEIDPGGVEARKARRLHRRVYKSEGANACWHVDGEFHILK